ncbi:MAG TPA: hypothetical protein VHM88_08385 [Candidatus Acidoferrales bacterium]|nr:hypothetical protein [Candidatus Acidoferrales bacterium]
MGIPCQCPARSYALETAALAARALRSIWIYDHMTELSGATGTAVQFPLQD